VRKRPVALHMPHVPLQLIRDQGGQPISLAEVGEVHGMERAWSSPVAIGISHGIGDGIGDGMSDGMGGRARRP
jgi:hypothetical protein